MVTTRLKIEIHISDTLAPAWSAWFEDLHVDPHGGDGTLLTGIVPDQPALFGVLDRLRDLNLHLVSVKVEKIILMEK